MLTLMYIVHTLICLFLIVVVLLQSGKGADLSVFGGGSTQTAFGATGATSILHKLTVSFFVAFMVTTIAIALVESGRSGTSVMTDVDDTAAVEAVEEADEALDAAVEAADPEALDESGAVTEGELAPTDEVDPDGVSEIDNDGAEGELAPAEDGGLEEADPPPSN